jgi:low affinity Fe/Cu permease
LFDRFATWCSEHAGRAPFFVGCLLLVVIWTPTLAFLPLDTSQLIINTATSVITFLLVALLQNSQSRADSATQHKLNEIADALANLIAHLCPDDEALRKDIRELKAAVGLEHRERS